MSKIRKTSEFSDTVSETGKSGISVDNLTGVGRSPTITKAYINRAFSFLDSEEYNPYKQYDSIRDPEHPNVKRRSSMQDAQTQVTTRPRNRSNSDKTKYQEANKDTKEYKYKNPNVINITLDADEQSKKTNLRLSTGLAISAGVDNPSYQTSPTYSPSQSTRNSGTSYESLPIPLPPKMRPRSDPIPEDAPYVTNVSVISVHSGSDKTAEIARQAGPPHPLPPKSWLSVGSESPKKSAESESCISRSRIAVLVIIVLVLLVLTATVLALVYVFVIQSRGDTGKEKDETEAPLSEFDSFDGTIRLNETWSTALSNSSSLEYQQLADDVMLQLSLALNGSEYDQRYTARVTGMQEGSVLVLFEMILDFITETVDLLATIQEGFASMQEKNQLVINIEDPLQDIMLEAKVPTTSTSTTTTSTTTATTQSESTQRSTTVPTIPTVSNVISTSVSQSEMPISASTASTSNTLSSTVTPTMSTSSTQTDSTTPTTTSTTISTTTPTTTSSIASSTTERSSTTTTEPAETLWITDPVKTTPSTSVCVDVTDDRCTELGFTRTGYPNLLNKDSNEIFAYLTVFLESTVNRDCSANVQHFGCSLAYPKCSGDESKLIHPCKEYCQEIETACGIPLACNTYPDDDVIETCRPSPTPPVMDHSSYPEPATCGAEEFLCGNDICVHNDARCDGYNHCGDFSDETLCNLDTSLDCSFENGPEGTFCNFVPDVWYGEIMWRLAEGASPSKDTGPLYDHTFRKTTGHYALFEASGKYWQDFSRLQSPYITTDAEHCLRFYYFMYGKDVESLKVLYHYDVRSNEDVLWQRWRNSGPQWNYGYVTVPQGQFYIVFHATRGASYQGDIAIDDITLRRGACPELTCNEDEFKCSNGHCISDAYRCDSNNDCQDYSDERDCVCGTDQWQCGIGMCIPNHYRCDGSYQCPDLTDEMDCGMCTLGRIKCENEEKCIQREWLCDRENDCADGWDESIDNCPPCTASQFQCNDYSCVSQDARCNGSRECSDGSDEYMCIRNTVGVLEVYNGDSWKPVCFESFPEQKKSSLCPAVGMGALEMYEARIEADSSTGFLSWDAGSVADGESLLAHLQHTDDCPNSQVIALQCAASDCGSRAPSLPQTFVINGNDADEGEWPWQVGIYLLGNQVCGGSLISPNHVATAAHCFEDGHPLLNFQIWLGSIHRTQGDEKLVRRSISNVKMHPSYSAYMHFLGYDIAIVTLSQPVEYSDYIRPICLADETDVFPLSSVCYASGWGYIHYNISQISEILELNTCYNQTHPDVLQDTKLKLWTHTQCQKSYPYLKDSMICAGYTNGYTTACIGDSGGPLQCQDDHGVWKLVGVLSFVATGCSRLEKPPVFTRASYYNEWIQTQQGCQFVCDNGNCLLDGSDICDGEDDCGDLSDEINNCAATLSCGFEDEFQCGYSFMVDSSIDKWTAYASNTAPFESNIGPTVDQSGENFGRFMFAGRGTSRLLSPVLDLHTGYCLQFYYHMRGRTVGSLRVLSQSVDANIRHPQQVTLNSPREILRPISGNKEDFWKSELVDLEAGRQVLVFEATEMVTGANEYSIVAIDSVDLFPGSCSDFECSQDEITCAEEQLCVRSAERCNYHSACEQQTDEGGCDSMNTYTCDFENYLHCGLQQEHSGDRLDWELVHSEMRAQNVPSVDHTYNTDQGFFGYLNTREIPGQRARLALAIKTPDSMSCMVFHYNMVSKGSLVITFYKSSSDHYTAWSTADVNNPTWQEVQIALPAGVMLINIDAIPGTGDDVAAISYIAIDDITIANNVCESLACSPDEFRCNDGMCILSDYECDGFDDCEDHSDEDFCECTAGTFKCLDDNVCLRPSVVCDGVENCRDASDELDCFNCTSAQFQCDNGQCRSRDKWCDGSQDCSDGSDELPDCECVTEQYRCSNGQCIMGVNYCDGQTHCSDGSDEIQDCTCNDSWHFTCVSSATCIPAQQRCDGQENCSDGSDELNCSCSPDEFRCNDGTCIPSDYECDGFDDCNDFSDEDFCECTAGTFKCLDDNVCLRPSVVCNGVENCRDASDELDCFNCTSAQFQCDNGQCRSRDKWCDGSQDCSDGSDELPDCECLTEQYRCSNGQCIMGVNYCDGQTHCSDDSDEIQDCTCNDSWHFTCESSATCIPAQQRCDGQENCSDGSDELNCFCNGNNEFLCNDGRCLTNVYCDGYPNCSQAEDELNCVCPESTFTCASGQCIKEEFECDGHNDCLDLSDETNCECLEDESRCANNRCIPADQFCDGKNDCGDYSDERDCEDSCLTDEHQCDNGICIAANQVCNGHDECGDDSDEIGCDCRIGETRCNIDGTCIQNVWICDGNNDCSDGQDETDCPSCAGDQFQCHDYSCIEMEMVCDGNPDCSENHDELNCVSLKDVTDHTGILHVKDTQHMTTYPVCYDNWQPAFSNEACHLLGKGPALSTSSAAIDSDTYKLLPANSTTFNIGNLVNTQSCDSGEAVKITCEEKTCGHVAESVLNTGSAFIVGGDIAREGAWPWVGGLYYHGAFLCSVVLIDKDWVMTAAHCFTSSNGVALTPLLHVFTVEIGSNRRSSSSAQKLQLDAIYIHPNFRSTSTNFLYNDVALLRLSTSAELNDKVQTLCLPDVDTTFSTHALCYTVGWGFTYRYRDGHDDLALDLREAKLTLMDTSACDDIGAWPLIDGHTQVCAGYSNQYITTCKGDSGSPIMCRDYLTGGWNLLGISSQGPSECGASSRGPPPLFMRVKPYLNWIRSKIGSFKR